MPPILFQELNWKVLPSGRHPLLLRTKETPPLRLGGATPPSPLSTVRPPAPRRWPSPPWQLIPPITTSAWTPPWVLYIISPAPTTRITIAPHHRPPFRYSTTPLTTTCYRTLPKQISSPTSSNRKHLTPSKVEACVDFRQRWFKFSDLGLTGTVGTL